MSGDLQTARRIASEVDPERLRRDLLDMLRIPSPPEHEREVSEHYAGILRRSGVDVELDEEIPASPTVIGRLQGKAGGPTLQLDGHTDTIAAPGPEVRCEGDWIYGRGACDMKAGLVAMAEAARVIVNSGVKLNGNLLLTAHGLHEPGTNETLESLIDRGVHGDAVIVTEGFGERLPLVGMGLAIWELSFSREGEAVHENSAPEGTPHPLRAGVRAASLLEKRSQVLAAKDLEHLGPESIFIGKFQCGDYFNRVPTSCTLAGSRRFGPDSLLADMRGEFEDLAREVGTEFGLEGGVSIRGLESYRAAEDEAIVEAVRWAHREVRGQDMVICGLRSVGNVSNFVRSAGVPAVYCGVSLDTAHSDNERTSLSELMEVTRIYVHAVLGYLGVV